MTRLLSGYVGNVLAAGLHEMGGATATVERDADGLPVAWRLFGFGPFTITRDGQTFAGEFGREHGERIVAHARQKREKIPIDSEHFLHAMAEELGTDEGDLAALTSRRTLAMGFGALALRADGLWIEGVEWVPLARRVLAQGVVRWYSPVVRGLADGRLRVTSVALTNSPALDGLDKLVAGAESDDAAAATAAARHAADTQGGDARKGASRMQSLLAKLGALAGLAAADAAALTAESAETALLPKLEPLLTELPALRKRTAAGEALMAELRTGLALAAEAPAAAVKGAVLALVEKQKADALALSEISGRVQALESEKTERERRTLIERGLAEGKLTPALVEAWADKQDGAALSAFLAAAPVIVAPGQTVRRSDLRGDDSVALSAVDRKVAELLGIAPETMEKTKKAQKAA